MTTRRFTGCLTREHGVDSPVDITVTHGIIHAIAPAGTEPLAELENVTVMSMDGLVAMPGLSNAHTHSPMALMRGVAEDVSVEDWFNTRVWPMETNLTPERVRAGARLACAEMLLSGITRFADHYFHADQIAHAAIEIGIRADIAPAFFTTSTGRDRDEAFETTRRLADLGHPRVTASVGPHAPYTVNDKDLHRSAALARELGTRVHIHAAENMSQTRASIQNRKQSPIEVVRDTGILDAGVLIAHGCGIRAADVDVLSEYADRTAVATCPKVYLKHAISPMTPIRGLLSAGVTVGIGTDGASGHNTLDVWEAIRLTALTQKQQEHDPEWLPVGQALDLGIRTGARAAGTTAPAELTVGAPADLVFVDLTSPHCQPLHDLDATLVYASRASDVRTVVVGGELVVHDRRLLTADLDEIIADAHSVAPALLRTQPGQAVNHYAP